MPTDINLHHEIPQDVKDAALLLGNYFKKQGIDNWTLYDVSSRNTYVAGYEMGYNSSLDTAISLAKEHGDCEALVCGLENSKKRIYC